MKIYTELECPLGKLNIAEKDGFITNIFFETDTLPGDYKKGETLLLQEAKGQLLKYFEGGLFVFNLPLNPSGTAFQKNVWRELIQVPYGTTETYGNIAKKSGNEKASRAVGGANNKNPIAIVIPCHRIIGKNGSLTGYRGGLTIKEWLLSFEKSKAQL